MLCRLMIQASLNVTIFVIALSTSLKYLVIYNLSLYGKNGTIFLPIYGNPVGYNLTSFYNLRGINLTAKNNSKYNIVSYYYQPYISNSSIIQFVFVPTVFYKNLIIKIYAPEGWVIENNSYSPPISYFITNGKRIGIEWYFVNQTPFLIDYSTPYLIFKFNAYQLSYNYYSLLSGFLYIIGVSGIIILTIVVISYFLSGKKIKFTKKHSKYRISSLSLLNDDEKAVLDKIGSSYIWQDELLKKFDFSKAKLSKILKKLETLKLIKIERIGKYNKIKRR